ncbi:signal peptide peptidase SppA [Desulfocurvus sp. DL9XJH121]
MPKPLLTALCAALVLLTGCSINIQAFRDYDQPYAEAVLSGSARGKVLLLPLRGFLSTAPREGLVSRAPGAVEEAAAQLARAEKDPDVRAVVLMVDSPGGSVTASEILYHEIMAFRARTQVPVVTLQMGLAASGGYMASLAGDVIVAHPSTITGSIGTIFISPNISGLMDKIGVSAEVAKSGARKDMGSPFKAPDQGDQALLQAMIDDLNSRFLALVGERRKLDPKALDDVADARVLTASQALRLGLVDKVGFAEDALAEARALAGLPEDARVVAYRRASVAEDTLYNTAASAWDGRSPALVDLGPARLPEAHAGFHHLWAPGFSN